MSNALEVITDSRKMASPTAVASAEIQTTAKHPEQPTATAQQVAQAPTASIPTSPTVPATADHTTPLVTADNSPEAQPIKERNYFKGEQEMKNSALMIKKLRYYARFIVVCLQLNNAQMMLQLLDEVKALIDVYAATFNPVDKLEWSLVVKEMALFMQAVCSPVPRDESGVSLPISYRLLSNKRRPPRAEREGMRLKLQEAVIVGNRPTQIKFSELTLDMYYMLQVLERELATVEKAREAAHAAASADSGDTAGTTAATATATTAAPATSVPAEQPASASASASAAAGNTATATADVDAAKARPGSAERRSESVPPPAESEAKGDKPEAGQEKEPERDKTVRRNNPHKYVLYQPHFSQVQVHLAQAFREIGEQGCVLLYLSSEGAAPPSDPAGESGLHGFIGGVATSRRSVGETKDRAVENLVHTVHPADLLPYTRKPFFLIVESESSGAYRNMPNLFNQPLLCLLSPTQYPATNAASGSMYTFFLHSPIVAFTVVSQLTLVSTSKWTALQTMFDELETYVADLLWDLIDDPHVRRFLGDEFLRQIMVRHVLCCVVLGMHVDYESEARQPSAQPDRFKHIVETQELVDRVQGVVRFCKVEEFYRMGSSVDSSEEPAVEPEPVSAPPVQMQMQTQRPIESPKVVPAASEPEKAATPAAPATAPSG
ncbi:hypothetical protein GGI07_000579 [Coemansia sp. Benny D115]|nr:hypothetical protein GGI07_000579 [Coemansia sp. Benny D115]